MPGPIPKGGCRDLLVRVAGYNNYFVDPDIHYQEEIIARTGQGAFDTRTNSSGSRSAVYQATFGNSYIKDKEMENLWEHWC